MNLFQTIILISLIGNTGLGLFVLLSNPKRGVNIAFFCLTIGLMLWLCSMLMASGCHSYSRLMFWVRTTSALAGVIPIGVFALHLAIIKPGISLREILYRLRYWLLACIALTITCYSPYLVISTTLSTAEQTVPVSQYGPGFIPYLAFFTSVVLAMSIGFWRTSKSSSGSQQIESQFLQMGYWLSFSGGLSLFGASVLFNIQEASRFLPLAVLVWDGFVAYGIATRRILAASTVLQRVVAYGLMTLYLIALYMFSVWLGNLLFFRLVPDTTYLTHLLAALVVAFSVAPAHGWMQAFAHRLFSSVDLLNVNVLLERAGQIFQEVSTEADLMTNFTQLVSNAFGTTKVILLCPAGVDSYRQTHPEATEGHLLQLPADSAIPGLLTQEHEAFTVDTLQRMRPTPPVVEAIQVLESSGTTLAVGSFMRKDMKAILLLSSKTSGKFYDIRDQSALQLLCDQFAVALENASLYTALQNSNIYNDILLDSLTSGIIAINSDRVITVFNLCAQNLTGLSETAAVGNSVTVLPLALVDALEGILATKSEFRDKDMTIQVNRESIPLRVSGSMFHSHTGELLGALLVFNEMTMLKKMEEQIRRTDRLSSIGTLSAGMAHEIRNPLVTIKTFTQLLPQKHQEADFRKTFFELVGQEVNRIDVIVNRLLNFARPAMAVLRPVSLHEVLQNSLDLVEQQLFQKEIAMELHLDAEQTMINADAEQLNQTFINLFLNAIQAMDQGGTLTVRTTVLPHTPDMPMVAELPDGDRIQVDVQDTGCGMGAEALRKIFDPFFTTKEQGVGLGLSVSHGIIQEHGGTVDVESQKGHGTVFHVQFPLMGEQAEVEG